MGDVYPGFQRLVMSGQRRSVGEVTHRVTPVTSVASDPHVGHAVVCVRREGFGNGFVAVGTDEVHEAFRCLGSDVGCGGRRCAAVRDGGAPTIGEVTS